MSAQTCKTVDSNSGYYLLLKCKILLHGLLKLKGCCIFTKNVFVSAGVIFNLQLLLQFQIHKLQLQSFKDIHNGLNYCKNKAYSGR